MTPQRWQQVKSTLAEALEQDDTASRIALLDVRCADDTGLRREVESLLAQPDDPFVGYANSGGLLQAAPPAGAGRRIGAYELVREIGRGGMGSVWLARRADSEFHKEVAIKLLKRGTDTDEVLRRFRAEREILARLEHPNIARLLDGGTTDDGLPYFVMEYVRGVRLTDFVRAEELPLIERLRLFLKICSAIALAHQNLVVHRDLKPGNILVTAEGEPKLLDFGIAKLLGAGGDAWEVTIAGRERLTPGYASPEQVRGEPVTTVSDVYALGAILYELLAGQPAHRFGESHPTATEMLRVVCEEEPVRPSLAASSPEMRRSLRGDLDTIVLRALAKAPERRYRGAGSLADDIRRYLDGRPVRARPDTLRYRATKFVARNKTAVAATVLVFAALIAGAATTMWQARRAERRFEDVRKIANSLMFEFHDSIRDVPGTLAARQLVTRRALQYLDGLAAEAGNDLSLKNELATAYERVAEITFETQQAVDSHGKAAALKEELVRAEPGNSEYRKQLAVSYNRLADVSRIAGHSDQSISFSRKAVAAAEVFAAEFPEDPEARGRLVDHYYALAFNLIDAGDAKPAVQFGLKAVDLQEPVIARDPANAEERRRWQLAYSVTSFAYEEAGQLETALAYSRRHIESVRALLATAPESARYRRDLWSSMLRMGRQFAAISDTEAAFQHYAQAIELMESLSAADPNDKGHRRWLAVTYTSTADLHRRVEQPEAALQLYRKAIGISEELLSGDPNRVEARRDLTRMYHSLGSLMLDRGELSEAEGLLSKAATMADLSAQQDPQNAKVRSRLADVCAAMGALHTKLAERATSQPRERESKLRAAVDWYERSLLAWQHVQQRGMLSGADAGKLDAAARDLAACEAALSQTR